MTDALRARLGLTEPVRATPREEYRAARDRVDLYAEAIAARKYVAQLENKVAELETRLRARPSRNTW